MPPTEEVAINDVLYGCWPWIRLQGESAARGRGSGSGRTLRAGAGGGGPGLGREEAGARARPAAAEKLVRSTRRRARSRRAHAPPGWA